MTQGFLAHLAFSAVVLFLVAKAVRGIRVGGPVSALLAALVLGLVNAVVRPLALVLALPLTLPSFGLVLLAVNGLMLKLAAAVVPGFRVRGLLPALWGALLLTVINVLVEVFVGPGWAVGALASTSS